MIGVIGAGRMGGAIVRRLLDRGVAVAVFDADPAAVERAEALGARAMRSACEVADRTEVVLACLPSEEASLAAAREAAAGTRIATYAELSTVGRGAMTRLATLFGATAVDLVDAPVIGNPAAVARGGARLMLAGAPEARALVCEAAAAFAEAVVHVGDIPGQAQLCRLVDVAIARTALLASCETIAAGAAAGIDPAVLAAVIAAGTGRNRAVTDIVPAAILSRSFDHGESVDALRRELGLYLAEAARAGMHEGVVSAAQAIWSDAAIAADADISEVVRHFERHVAAETG